MHMNCCNQLIVLFVQVSNKCIKLERRDDLFVAISQVNLYYHISKLWGLGQNLNKKIFCTNTNKIRYELNYLNCEL